MASAAPRDPFDPSAFSGISAGFDSLNDFNDSVAFTDTLALDDDPLFPADWDQETPPYDGNLYSTPLSWELPTEPKIEPIPSAPYTTMNTLTPAQQEKLRNIAMPQHLQYRNHNSPHSTASTKSHSISSPDHNERSLSLRIMTKSARGEDTADDREELQGLTPAHKLNKATVSWAGFHHFLFCGAPRLAFECQNQAIFEQLLFSSTWVHMQRARGTD